MKVRIVRRPSIFERWEIQRKTWYGMWVVEEYFIGPESRALALKYAHLLTNPEVIEVTK